LYTGLFADLIDGRAAVRAFPDQLPDGSHQSFFGITDAAHKQVFLSIFGSPFERTRDQFIQVDQIVNYFFFLTCKLNPCGFQMDPLPTWACPELSPSTTLRGEISTKRFAC